MSAPLVNHPQCAPADWRPTKKTGVAVQYWGDAPACNHTAPPCKDYLGRPACCSSQCEVLGVGLPQWQLREPQNPQYGGISVTFRGVAPSDTDTHMCPWDPKTGAERQRTVIYNVSCDPSMSIGACECSRSYPLVVTTDV